MERAQQIGSLLQEALQRPAAERDAFLRQACGSDSDLLPELRSRMADVGQGLAPAPAPSNSILQPGQTLGPYQIVSFLAAGGMVAVYRARPPHRPRLSLAEPAPSAPLNASRAKYTQRPR